MVYSSGPGDMSCSTLSPPKALLLAVHLAAHADIHGLRLLSSRHPTVLRKSLLLRVILTNLPETTDPVSYVGLLQEIESGTFDESTVDAIDLSPVSALSDHEAAHRAKKLHLDQLSQTDAPGRDDDDALSDFLYRRALRMDSETGMLSQLPDLLMPFIHHSPHLRVWVVSTVLPFVRRNCEYYAEAHVSYSLNEFQHLPGPDAVRYLLSRTGLGAPENSPLVARDLRGLVMPWLLDESRWAEVDQGDQRRDSECVSLGPRCLGWEQAVTWLTSQASESWRVLVSATDHWDGPADVDLGGVDNLSLPDAYHQHVLHTYARAVVASVFGTQDTSEECLGGLYRAVFKIRASLGQGGEDMPLQDALSSLPRRLEAGSAALLDVKSTPYTRTDLLRPWNPVTSPVASATGVVLMLTLGASVLAGLGAPLSVRRLADMVLLKDEREQKAEVCKALRALSDNAPRGDDQYWIRARLQILWLGNWAEQSAQDKPTGPLAAVPRCFVESEILKTLLSNTCYSLAQTLYESDAEKPLPTHTVQDAVYQAALNAFDNASNPNRTRGGLKKCDDIIRAFPKSMGPSLPGSVRLQALLKATHALSDYRLVLKQGEPFSPVVLRVHSDPIAVIGKILEQNDKAYTRLQEFLEMGFNLVRAGLPSHSSLDKLREPTGERLGMAMFVAEKRIISMCVEAALREDDFETAYSYVVSRLGAPSSGESPVTDDEWSWQAALKAGQYVRTERSQPPTHLGTASGNLEIRHLEQRIECLATALRVAPTTELQEVLKSFRRCEEQLDSAIKEEADSEAAWDAAGTVTYVPGAFDSQGTEHLRPPRNITAAAAARQAEEAPMSLFDLSRATARVAQRSFNGLPSLQGMAGGGISEANNPSQTRIRKRDQLREAATGTLVSGVGWLIGANVHQGRKETE
ncbi:protein transport protein Sec39 [Purpureocillium lavendulum]|uniref:Protein transport protein Sec39 n=1 Tax=Purpureocillium lavendulum TaxID=1247861 RepID=A0AB34FZ71_9HYPO|nr:protein transport protein Sec39 [Purpureocillium lavendulum]